MGMCKFWGHPVHASRLSCTTCHMRLSIISLFPVITLNECKKTTFKMDSYRRQCGTSKTSKIGCFDRFPCTVSPLQCSRILLTRSGETVHRNLSKHLIFCRFRCVILSAVTVLFKYCFYMHVCCFFLFISITTICRSHVRLL